jgi:hypothetical protein
VTEQSAKHDGGNAHRPQAAFRVGLVGERTLAPALHAPLIDLAQQAFRRIAASVRQVADGAGEREVYREGGPVLHCISMVAGDSDAVLVPAALDAGFELSVVLPYALEDQLAQAGPSRRRCEELIAAAGPRVLQLDGTTEDIARLARPARDMAQDAAGRMLARNCDLLLAIWTGATNNEVAATVHAALAGSVPVLWMLPESPPGVCLVHDDKELRSAAPGTVLPVGGLADHVGKLLALPRPVAHAERHWIHVIENIFFGEVGADDNPVKAYLEQTPPAATSADALFGRLFFATRNLLAGKVKLDEPQLVDRDEPHVRPASAVHYRALFERPDALASYYAGRYRTTFLSVFILGALATSMVLASASFPEYRFWFLGAELLMLVAVVLLLRWERSANCHGHWLDYRLLAETLRLQQVLAPLGHSASLRPLLEGAPAYARRREWVSWYFSALLRERPLDGGCLDGRSLTSIRNDVHNNLLASAEGQILYFAHNAQRYRNAGRLLQGVALIIFPAALALLIAKMVTDSHRLTLLAGLLPTLATAMFAIRSHGEFEVLAQNGERITPQLHRAAERLRGLELDQPLASEALAAEVLGIATVILSDIQGWSLLFNVKVVEAA